MFRYRASVARLQRSRGPVLPGRGSRTQAAAAAQELVQRPMVYGRCVSLSAHAPSYDEERDTIEFPQSRCELES